MCVSLLDADPRDRAIDALRRHAGEPSAVASAPGRANLVGGHTDYNDGLVLPVAVDRRVAVAARPGDGLTAHSVDYDASHRAGDPDPPDWFAYVQGVAAALSDRGYPVGDAELAISGDVPQGAGLASSAALEVSTALALLENGGYEADPREVAEACHAAETEHVGVNCGIMDQFSVALARPGHALALDCRDRSVEHVPLDSDRFRVVVVDTNVRHSLVDSAYNDRRADCERGAALLDDLLDHEVRALRDVSPEEFERVADELPETVRRRCLHVVEENARVEAATEALADGDLEALGSLLVGSHESLRDLYDVSCDSLDAVVDVALDTEGVYGARMTGAGFGGSVVAVVAPDAVDRLQSRIETVYDPPTGAPADVFVCGTAGGAVIH